VTRDDQPVQTCTASGRQDPAVIYRDEITANDVFGCGMSATRMHMSESDEAADQHCDTNALYANEDASLTSSNWGEVSGQLY